MGGFDDAEAGRGVVSPSGRGGVEPGHTGQPLQRHTVALDPARLPTKKLRRIRRGCEFNSTVTVSPPW
jgi:hypothetical protein